MGRYIYVVTTPYDDAVNPKPGTLRYGVIQTQPLWIVFAKDMVIKLENELIMNSFKTIDGRGAKVEIAYGPCITVQGVSHVIIHGISIHDCKPGKSGLVRSSPTHVGRRGGSDGDGISVFASSNVWIDHCFLARCADGLIDVIHALQKKLFFATCSSPRVQSLYTWRTVARGHVNTRGGSM